MNNIPPAVVVVAYNRPAPLQRLLQSLSQAKYQGSVPLIISIDHSGSDEVRVVAEAFPWAHGPKRVIAHESRLGLRPHILKCGDLVEEFGAVIILEDDLTVSPAYYDFVLQALAVYSGEEQVCGISLYRNYTNPEFKPKGMELMFSPVQDGFDNFFLQHVSSWGQCWTRDQWHGFRQWLAQRPENAPADNSLLPPSIRPWSDASSWAKFFQLYMLERDKYFVFPQVALSTNWGESGANFGSDTSRYQVPLLLETRQWKFSRLSESLSIYDVQFEIVPTCLKRANPALAPFDFETDLCGVKELDRVRKPYLLTSRETDPGVISFGASLFPMEMNVFLRSEGTGINLVETAALLKGPAQSQKQGAGTAAFRFQTQARNLQKVLNFEEQKNELKRLKTELKAARHDLQKQPIRAWLRVRKLLKDAFTKGSSRAS